MSEYSETRNAAVNDIIARLWEFDDDESRFAILASVFSVKARHLELDPIDMSGNMVAVYRLITQEEEPRGTA
jgi:hypothetical protein